jgi:hypothetical protein
MRQLYKDCIIGLILASFTFSPVAFAKPQEAKVRNASKAPLYANLIRTVKKSRKGLLISDFAEASRPMVKNREFRDIRGMLLPYWSKKFEQFTLGKDYFKIKYKGQRLFVRYVDRGGVAFMVNNKPLLWKDVLIYGRAKARMTEIINSTNLEQKKLSFLESLISELFPKAFADDGKNQRCRDLGGTVKTDDQGNYAGCTCPNGVENGPNVMPVCPTEIEPEPVPTEPIVDECDDGQPKQEDGSCPPPVKAPSKINPLLIGAGMLLLLFLLLKKKKKKKGDDGKPNEPENPVPGWTPEPEGQCPTPGARDLKEEDLPPQCRTSGCEGSGCSSGSGVIY